MADNPAAKSILIVDDSKITREMVKLCMERAAYRVFEAVDGVDGLTKAKTHSPNLILLDQNMPNMDGTSLIRILRALPQFMTVPILFLTTESSDRFKQDIRNLGASGILVKPFDAAGLTGVVQKLVSQ